MWHKCTALLISSAGPIGSIAICWLADICWCVAIPLHYWTSQKVIGHECLCPCGYAIPSLYFQAIDSIGRWAGSLRFALSLLDIYSVLCSQRNWLPVDPTKPEIIMQGQRRACCGTACCLKHTPPTPQTLCTGTRRLSSIKL